MAQFTSRFKNTLTEIIDRMRNSISNLKNFKYALVKKTENLTQRQAEHFGG